MRSKKAMLCCVIALSLSGVAARAQADSSKAGVVADQAPEAGIVHGRQALLSATSGPGSYQPLSGKQRWDLYLRDTFWNPGVVFRTAGPALGAQLNSEPAAWGQGAQGYSKRFANRFGRFALKQTYEAAGAAALGHEVRYLRSKRTGFLPRVAHALVADFVTYDRNGRRRPHVARVGSVVAAEFTGNLWMPAGYGDTPTAMRAVGAELGVSSASNLIREFAPELKRTFTWK